jgi:hypothetical protein
MIKDKSQRSDVRSRWPVGTRVKRKHTDQQGTVVEQGGGSTKVKWDDGKTSYYRRGELGDVEREKPPGG